MGKLICALGYPGRGTRTSPGLLGKVWGAFSGTSRSSVIRWSSTFRRHSSSSSEPSALAHAKPSGHDRMATSAMPIPWKLTVIDSSHSTESMPTQEPVVTTVPLAIVSP